MGADPAESPLRLHKLTLREAFAGEGTVLASLSGPGAAAQNRCDNWVNGVTLARYQRKEIEK